MGRRSPYWNHSNFGYCLLRLNRSSQQETRSDLEKIKDMLSTLIGTVKNIPEVSSAQLSSFLTLAQPVCHQSAPPIHSWPQQQPITLHSGPAQFLETSHGGNDRRNTDKEDEETSSMEIKDEFSTSIDRLCRLAEKKENTVFSGDEAYAIIDDLEKLLDIISKNITPLRHEEGKGKRKFEDNHSLSNEECRDFKRVKALLISSPSVALNENGMY